MRLFRWCSPIFFLRSPFTLANKSAREKASIYFYFSSVVIFRSPRQWRANRSWLRDLNSQFSLERKTGEDFEVRGLGTERKQGDHCWRSSSVMAGPFGPDWSIIYCVVWVGITYSFCRLCLKGVNTAIYVWLFRHYRLTTLPLDTWWAWVGALLATDLAYYWFHRASHGERSWTS